MIIMTKYKSVSYIFDIPLLANPVVTVRVTDFHTFRLIIILKSCEFHDLGCIWRYPNGFNYMSHLLVFCVIQFEMKLEMAISLHKKRNCRTRKIKIKSVKKNLWAETGDDTEIHWRYVYRQSIKLSIHKIENMADISKIERKRERVEVNTEHFRIFRVMCIFPHM